MATVSPSPQELASGLQVASPEEKAEVLRLLELREAMSSPAAFAVKASGGRFERPPHIELLNRALVDLADGRIRKLMVTLPPRHGKSELCSKYLPAWFLARWPDRKVILASYEATFAASWGGLARDVLVEAEPWCGVRVADDSKARSEWRIEHHTGVMYTAGRGGKTTGMGAHLFVIDDPFKNAKEADSEVIREEAWNWYMSVANTRMETPPEWDPDPVESGAQLLIQTRWHEDDLGGRLMETQPGQWTIINLPALAEDEDPLGREPGEALWPSRYSVPKLEQTRQNLVQGEGIRWWWALYQQRPTSAEGNEFDMASIQYFDLIETGDGPTIVLHRDGKPDELYPLKRMFRFGTMDLAISQKTRADWTVLSSWAATRRFPTDLCLLDVMRGRVDSGGHVAYLERGLAKHKLQYVGIEDKTFGSNLLQEAARRRLAARPIPADTDKVTRAQPAATMIRARRLWLPRLALPWRDIVESEMTAFPQGKHDDCVDTLSMAAIEVETRRMERKPKDEPRTPEEKAQEWISKRIGRNKKGKRDHPFLGRL